MSRSAILGECDAAAAADATDRERDRLALQASSKLTECPLQTLSSLSNFVKPVPRDAAAAAAQRLADLRASRAGTAKEAEVAAKEAEYQQMANAQGRAFRKHAGTGSVDGPAVCSITARPLWPGYCWAAGIKAECDGCCLGGGRLGQMPECGRCC